MDLSEFSLKYFTVISLVTNDDDSNSSNDNAGNDDDDDDDGMESDNELVGR